MRENISSSLGLTKSLETRRYLGMPTMIGRKKKTIFNYLRDKIWKKLQHWSSKHLSKARREVLINQLLKLFLNIV